MTKHLAEVIRKVLFDILTVIYYKSGVIYTGTRSVSLSFLKSLV